MIRDEYENLIQQYKVHLITNIAIREEKGILKKLLFQNEIIIYKKEYDIRLVASLITDVSMV